MANVTFPGLQSPSAGFDAPFELLHACHERVQRTLQLLHRLQDYLTTHTVDDNARSAATDVMRYFDMAAPLHHQDEEIHVFPILLAGGSADIQTAVQKLQEDHRHMHDRWASAREVLATIVDVSADRWIPLNPAQVQALVEFSDLYAGHIETEEQMVYPASQGLLTEVALADMRQDMMARRGVLASATSTDAAFR